MKKRLSIKARLTLWYAALIVLMCAFALYVLFTLSHRAQMEFAERTLRSSAVIILDEMETEHGEIEIDADIDDVPNVYAALFDMDGRLVYGRRRVALPFEEGSMRVAKADGHSWMILDTLVDVPDHAPLWLRLHMSADLMTDVEQTILHQVVWVLPLLGLLALLGGYALSRRALLPVRDMTRTAASIADGSALADKRALSRYESGGDELHALANTLEDMLKRLEISFERERRFTSDAAHELRTPLNALRVQGEYALSCSDSDEKDEAIARMLDKSEEMRQLIDQLLLIARLDAGQIPMEDEISLHELLDEVVQDMEPVAQEQGMRIHADLEAATVRGHRALLTRAAVNLVDNAIRYGRKNGEIWITLTHEDGHAVIQVRDNGDGIRSEALEHVFERFWRGDQARTTPGTGIGLAMVLSAAKAHGGSADAESRVGEGSCFKISIPSKR